MAAKIVAFMNQKGGVGKTTATVNIGAFLAKEHRKRVLLVDIDPQGSLSEHVGLSTRELGDSIYDVWIRGADPRRIIRRMHGLEVLPANQELAGADVELPRLPEWNVRLRNALSGVREQYDFILMDCPPSLGVLTVSGLAAADLVLVPMEAEYLALLGVSQLLDTVDMVKRRINPGLEIGGVIFCRFDGRTTLARGVKADIDKHFPGKVFAAVIRQNIRLAEAPSHRLPICEYDPKSPGADDYRKATVEFLERFGIASDIPEVEVETDAGDIMAETPVIPEDAAGRGEWQRQPLWR
ncbi:MAG: ParA family protein [Planctomycetota bacterium]|jgi:chromosome partitioning protein|nr:ParA family protein [Planctomycetota bacterium]